MGPLSDLEGLEPSIRNDENNKQNKTRQRGGILETQTTTTTAAANNNNNKKTDFLISLCPNLGEEAKKTIGHSEK
ncbi:hypothetical protein OUZ56_021124 [Daphnia magna]|uniref:Uncharacterized protein n=1 Tax=Daphnia magna TaxID=35525 RepID=A0ABQ9ZGG1_9CRUS|nr:hypothetical protein OUZ56_021124 [Daphnia magna]